MHDCQIYFRYDKTIKKIHKMIGLREKNALSAKYFGYNLYKIIHNFKKHTHLQSTFDIKITFISIKIRSIVMDGITLRFFGIKTCKIIRLPMLFTNKHIGEKNNNHNRFVTISQEINDKNQYLSFAYLNFVFILDIQAYFKIIRTFKHFITVME